MESGIAVSHVTRLRGINANQIFKWRMQYEDGSLTAVALGEEVAPAPISKSMSYSALWAKRRWEMKY